MEVLRRKTKRLNCEPNVVSMGFPGGSVAQNPPAIQETRVQSLGHEDPPEEDMETHSSIFAWESPRTEEPGRLQSTGTQRARHDLRLNNIYARRWWQQREINLENERMIADGLYVGCELSLDVWSQLILLILILVRYI